MARRLNTTVLSFFMSVCPSICMSICCPFEIFQKRGFEIAKIDLSNMTKLILLDSLFQEVTTRGNTNSNLSHMAKPIFLDSLL